MLEMYGVVEPGQRQVLVDMAREGHRKGWWADYDDVLPSGFDIYVGLEAETAAERVYEISVVHGLLQTPDYARAVLREMFPRHGPSRSTAWWTCGSSGSGGSTTTRPLTCGPIIDEAVDPRPVGGKQVMRGQLEHLLRRRPGPG